MKKHRPTILNEVPLDGIFLKPQLIVTMSTGQWDGLLAAAYDNDWILLELDDNELPIRAYRRNADAEGGSDPNEKAIKTLQAEPPRPCPLRGFR